MRGEETGAVDLDPPVLPDAAQMQAARDAGATLPKAGLGRLAVLSVDDDAPHAGIKAIEALWSALPEDNHAAEFVIAVDADADPTDLEKALFRWLSNADPERDRVMRSARIGFDGRRKTPGRDDRDGVPVRDYPPLVDMTPEIIDRVDRRWSEYGFTGPPVRSRFQSASKIPRDTDEAPR